MPLIILLPVLVPLCGGIALGMAHIRQQGDRYRWLFIATLLLNVLAVIPVASRQLESISLFTFNESLSFSLCSDDLARASCMFVSLVFLLVGIYSDSYMSHDRASARFHCFILLVLSMINGLCLAGNLMTLLVFFEAITLASLPLVMHTMTKEAVAATFKYLYYSIAGAALAVIGLFHLYANDVSLTFASGGTLHLSQVSLNDTAVLIIILLSILGFSAKAGLFPLHAWLPAAHPVAPAPASALLSGVITKAGVFAVIRFVFYIVGADNIRSTWVHIAWVALTAFTILFGSIHALRETLLKRRLAFSSISQVSYILFGLSTLTYAGYLGALWHMVVHCLVKNALFLNAGSISKRTDKTWVGELQGLGQTMPITMGCFTFLALTAVGIPPAGGFISKWHLMRGALTSAIDISAPLGIMALLGSALLSAAYLLPIVIAAFFPAKEHRPVQTDGELSDLSNPGFAMTVPVFILTAAALLSGLLPVPLPGILSHLAQITGLLIYT